MSPQEDDEMDPDFHIDLLFPDEYSDFIAETYYKDRLVFVISQEKGPDNLELEFGSDVRGFPEKMSLRGLEIAINNAKQRLNDLRKSE
jgi:hypothetical protein